MSWSQAVTELFQSIDLDSFLTVENYSEDSLSDAENKKTHFIVTTFVLNHLDSNNNVQARNFLANPADPSTLVYDPFKIWKFLKNRHAKITEVKLSAVTKALYACKIQRSDSLSAYLDRFENLIREFFLYKGQMSDTQSARMLIDSIHTLSETTSELIHAQVVPLTRQGVADYLREYENRQGWMSPAMREANSADASSSNRARKSGYKGRCTEDVCNGPHPERECWSKPENANKKEEFLARRQAENRSNNSSSAAASTIKGRKKISPPNANAAGLDSNMEMLLLHASYEDVSAASASASTATSTLIWALHDTGATHHMFNDIRLFDKTTLKPVDNANKRLKLAGGGVSLAVHSEGSVRLKAGDGSTFELQECLYIPELTKNLIAGGRLRLKGVREHFEDGDHSSFSLVIRGLATFNGYIGKNGLMNVLINPVSTLDTSSCAMATTDDKSQLHHRRLGHISDMYLNIMGSNECVDGLEHKTLQNGKCEICLLSKSKQLPYNHTRPRSQKFLENVHVDLSGIVRVKGLRNESYFAMFCDDYSSYQHIFPLKSKNKDEVFEVFRAYIALTERQTGERLKQFTLDRGGEFINDRLGPELRELGIVLHTTAGHV